MRRPQASANSRGGIHDLFIGRHRGDVSRRYTPSVTRVAYIVTASLPEQATLDRYVAWLHPSHTALVQQAGATKAEVIVLSDPPLHVQARYEFTDQPALDRYLRDHAPRLRAEGLAAFPLSSGITFRREIGTILASTRDVG